VFLKESRLRRRPFLIGLSLLGTAGPARADLSQAVGHNVQISPTTLDLGGLGSTTTCIVLNNGTVQTSSQIRLRSWFQAYGQDVLTETNDVVASPPFITLDPGTRQIVRVANLATSPGNSETCFRLLLNELPSAGNLTNSGVTVLIAFSLPVFVAGVDARPPQLTARFTFGPDGRPAIQFINAGDIHARLADVSYSLQGRSIFTMPGLAGYVLPHSTRDITLPIAKMPPKGGSLLGVTQLQTEPTPIELL